MVQKLPTIWLVPAPVDQARLKVAMKPSPHLQRLAKDPNSYPKFVPHITLASFGNPLDANTSLEAIEYAVQNLVDSTPKFSIEFQDIEAEAQVFYRSVYIKVVLSDALEDIRKDLENSLKLQYSPPLFPHISLCYITDKDRAERRHYLDELKYKKTVNTVQLKCGEEMVGGFSNPEIWLANCGGGEGGVKDWTIEKKYQFSWAK